VPNITKRLFFYIPFTILATAFLAICVHFRTAWPWQVPLHEDGQRTFFETVVYFEHALGELPLEVLLSAAVAGWVVWLYGLPAAKAGSLWNLGIIAVALDVTIFVGALTHVGARVAILHLLQYHTRDSEPMIFGSHWQYHLLAQLALMLLPSFVAQVGNLRPIANRPLILISSFASFAILTIIFGISAAPFTDARFLGHQARELFTHTLVTVPLAMGCCVLIPRGEPATELTSNRRILSISAIVACILLAAYLGAGVLLTHSQRAAQSNDWIKVICGHFFEHTISYLVVTVHSVFFYLLGARRG
jgi:hypothetical protein